MKKIIVIGLVSMFLLTGLTAISTGEISKIKEASSTKESPLGGTVYRSPKEILLQGIGRGFKSFAMKKAPLLRFYYVRIKLKENDFSWIHTAEGEHYLLGEGTYIIIGGWTGDYYRCDTNWFGRFSGLLPIHIYLFASDMYYVIVS